MRQANSEVLRAKIRMAEPRLQEVLSLFWNHPGLDEIFPEHLARLYFTVAASNPLLECAQRRARELAPDCAVAELLVPYYERHAREEDGHDEWVLDDLRVLGVSRDEVTSRIPPVETATLIGSQYYYVNHFHPLAVMSYLAVVEGNPPRKEFLDEIVARTSIPENALGVFYKHAKLDIQHSKDIWALVDSLPLEPWHETLLGMNAMLVTEQIAGSIESLLAKFDRR